jgi:Ser/Thr protein kinase RdoA (MazF antagonist)
MSTAEAAEALAAWWGPGAQPRLIKDRENVVYEVMLANGTRAALRLHRPGYQSAEAIRSELVWTRGLADVGLPVPRPVASAQGDLIHTLSTGRIASLVEWVAGEPLGEAWTRLPGTAAMQAETFRRIGALLARLHAATDALSLPRDFTRPAWDEDGLLGETPLWGRFWENPALTEPERAILQAARTKARARLAILRPTADYGLIHADLMRENLLIDGATIRLIDFDDSGLGFRLYDLGTLMIQNLDEPAYPDLLAAAAEGYTSLRPLDADLIPMFVMLRCLASCGWAVPRLPAGSPRLRDYATRAVRQAEGFLSSRI